MKQILWQRFCERFNVVEDTVPLFDTDPNGSVRVKHIGKAQKPILRRSEECEAMILSVTDTLIPDWTSGENRFDGMIYMMGWKRADKFVPLYIGKTESTGRGGGLSVNITNLHSDKSKFARWGDNYAYHVGDLSACVLPGHDEKKRVPKYQDWAARIFKAGTTTLKEPVYLWATAWDRSETGIWEEFGPTSLAFLEYLLIGVASGMGPPGPYLLNREGLSR